MNELELKAKRFKGLRTLFLVIGIVSIVGGAIAMCTCGAMMGVKMVDCFNSGIEDFQFIGEYIKSELGWAIVGNFCVLEGIAAIIVGNVVFGKKAKQLRAQLESGEVAQ